MKQEHKNLSIKILKIIGLVALVLTISAIGAPQLPYLIIRVYLKKKFGKTYDDSKVYNSLRYLKKKKFIAFKVKDSKLKIFLTLLGRQHLQTINIQNINIPQTKWDGKWRLLTFDIPEANKPARQFFRKKLTQLGFFHFQRSVFVIPYNCAQEIQQITKYLKISSFVHLISCDRFPGDKILVKKFNL